MCRANIHVCVCVLRVASVFVLRIQVTMGFSSFKTFGTLHVFQLAFLVIYLHSFICFVFGVFRDFLLSEFLFVIFCLDVCFFKFLCFVIFCS